MKFESTDGISLPKLGYGTWSIGGDGYPDPSRDRKSVAALRSALDLGYTHFDTAEMYAGGHAEELLGRAIREAGAGREKLFITSKVEPSNLHYSDVLKSCEASLRRMGMEQLDLYLIHWPQAGMNLTDTFRALNKLVREGKVKHLGVSNFDVKLLEAAQERSETSILTNQVPYSLSDRSYVKNGVLEYCQRHNILLTAYSPLDAGHLPVEKTLRAIADLHQATPHQIALAWLANQSRVIAIAMSFNPSHQKENIEAADIVLTDEEMNQLR